jgi:Uma2 family endonuclease
MKSGAPSKLTYDDFVGFPDDGKRHELIDGVHYVTPSPWTRHQQLVVELLCSLYPYLRDERRGEALSYVDVVLSNHDIVCPDVLVILAEQADIVTPLNLRGAPAIIVEIMSDVTRERDETLKRALYERAGVREYWTVDPDEDVVVVHRFEASDPETVTLRRGSAQLLTSPLLPGWARPVDDLLAR